MLIDPTDEGPPIEFIPGVNLGLPPGSELDGLSRRYSGVSPTDSFALLFSVTRTTSGGVPPDPELVGLGTPFNVAHQAERNQAAGDQYLALRLVNRAGIIPLAARGLVNNNVLSRNNWNEGGTDFNARPMIGAIVFNTFRERGIEPQDNVDAMSQFDGNNPAMIGPVFFSIASGGLPGMGGADVLVDLNPAAPGGESVYLSAQTMGLMAEDDIDGLIVFDDGVIGVADPGDQVLLTLRPGSFSLMDLGVGTADVLSYVHKSRPPGHLTLFAAANQLGLGGPFDAIDALDLTPCDAGIECGAQSGIRVTSCPALSDLGIMLLALSLLGVGAAVVRRSRCQLIGIEQPT
jgi:hypothetical protein